MVASMPEWRAVRADHLHGTTHFARMAKLVPTAGEPSRGGKGTEVVRELEHGI
jgi:hypothetical protein